MPNRERRPQAPEREPVAETDAMNQHTYSLTPSDQFKQILARYLSEHDRNRPQMRSKAALIYSHFV